MESNKYAGTMFSHCDSTLTDRMKSADDLVQKLQYIYDHIDRTLLCPVEGMLKELLNKVAKRCTTSNLQFTDSNCNTPEDVFRTLIYNVKTIFHAIYTSWVSGVQGDTPILAECINEVSEKINGQAEFQYVLRGRVNNWRGNK